MARKRMIDPGIWQSEDFSKLSTLAKLVFIGLFSNADDEGRGRAKAAYIKSSLFPYDEGMRIIDVDKTLSEIASNMSVTFYLHDDNEYYSLDNWNKWQKIDRPTRSNLPEPNEGSTIVRSPLDEHSTSTRRALAPNRIEKNRTEENKKRACASDRFDEFWAAYPRKTAKQDAAKAWKKIMPDEEMASAIINAVDEQSKSPQWLEADGKYVPYPATWLNGRRWEDSTAPPKKPDEESTKRQMTLAEIEEMARKGEYTY